MISWHTLHLPFKGMHPIAGKIELPFDIAPADIKFQQIFLAILHSQTGIHAVPGHAQISLFKLFAPPIT